MYYARTDWKIPEESRPHEIKDTSLTVRAVFNKKDSVYRLEIQTLYN